MTTVADFLASCALDAYAPRFIEQGIETLDDLRYERDLDSLIEDVGLLDADAEKFRVALKRALSDDKTTNSEKKSDGREEPSSNDLARAVASAVASSRARQGLDGGSGTARRRRRRRRGEDGRGKSERSRAEIISRRGCDGGD